MENADTAKTRQSARRECFQQVILPQIVGIQFGCARMIQLDILSMETKLEKVESLDWTKSRYLQLMESNICILIFSFSNGTNHSSPRLTQLAKQTVFTFERTFKICIKILK